MNAFLKQKISPACLVFRRICCLAFLPFVLGGCFVSPGQDQGFADHAAAPVELYDWEFHWGDAPTDARGIPVWTYEGMPAGFWQPVSTVDPQKGHPLFAWIRIRLPERLPGSAVVATDVIATSFEAYVDSVRIYRFGTLRPDPASKYALATAQVIPLPADAAGRMLYLRVYSEYPEYFGAHLPLLLATEGTILRWAFWKNLSQLIVGFIILTTGLIALLLMLQAVDTQRAKMLL